MTSGHQLKSGTHLRIVSNRGCPQLGQCHCEGGLHAVHDDEDVVAEGMFQTILLALYEQPAVVGHACVSGTVGQPSATDSVSAGRISTGEGTRNAMFQPAPGKVRFNDEERSVDYKVKVLAEPYARESNPTQQRLRQKQRHQEGFEVRKRP